MRHLHVVRLIAALVGLSLAASFPAMAAKPSPTPPPPKEMKLESERRYVPDENQGQKGIWIEHEVYTYRYDPWPEKLVKRYVDLFRARADLQPLIMAIHRKEKTLDQVLAQFEDLKGALEATGNDPSDDAYSLGDQYLDFDLLDSYYGKAWVGTYEDKRPLMAALYTSKVPIGKSFPAIREEGRMTPRPITTSCFVEITRLARIIAAMDAGIPMPKTWIVGNYLKYDTRSKGSATDHYEVELSREQLRAKMDAIYHVALLTDSKRPPRKRDSADNSNINWSTYDPVD